MGALAIALIAPKSVRALTRKELLLGTACGTFFVSGLIFAFLSMSKMHSGITAFLIGCCALFAPFMEYYALKRVPSKWQSIGLLVALAGMALLSLRADLNLDSGATYALISAVLFAAWSVSLSYAVRLVKPLALGLGQIFGGAALALLFAVLLGEFSIPSSATTWYTILYLGIVSVALRFIAQTWAQQFTTATSTEIVFLVEPCGALLWGYLFATEIPSALQLIGCGVILGGILVAQIPKSKSVA